MELREKTFDEIESIVSSAVEDAVDFVETEISEIRINNIFVIVTFFNFKKLYFGKSRTFHN